MRLFGLKLIMLLLPLEHSLRLKLITMILSSELGLLCDTFRNCETHFLDMGNRLGNSSLINGVTWDQNVRIIEFFELCTGF